MKHDAVYARYSSHRQDDGTSIDVQLEACHRLAGDPCVDYVDKAKTGRTKAGRKALLRLIADAEADKIARLFIYRYDRLGRSAETHAIVADLEDLDVEVISATEGKDALARGVQLVVAEHYSKALAERTRDGLLKRFDEGRWTGGHPPYGYEVVDRDGARKVAICDQEADAVRYAFRTYLAGPVGLKELAHQLNDKGFPTRRGGPWTFTTVRGILTNPIAVGRLRYNRRKFRLNKQTGRRVPIWRDEEDHQDYVDESLRLVSDEDFERVQRRIAERARPDKKPRSPKTIRPFTGQIRCEACGSPCYSRTSNNRKGQYRYYLCGKRQRHGHEACDNGAVIREDVLLLHVTTSLMTIFDDAEALVSEAVAVAEELLTTNRDEAGRLKRELAQVDREIAALTRQVIDPAFEDAAKSALSRELASRELTRSRLQASLAQLAEQADAGTDRLIAAVRQALHEARKGIENVATNAQLHELMEQFVGPMVLQRDGTVVQTETAPADAEADVPGYIAGAGFEPATSGL